MGWRPAAYTYKQGYQTRLRQLLDQRQKLREKHNWKKGQKNEPYMREVRKIAYTIGVIRRAIRKWEARHEKMDRVAESLMEFFNLKDMRAKCTAHTTTQNIARMIFCKYCMENGMTGPHIQRWLHITNKRVPSKLRWKLNRKMKSDPELHRIWRDWRAFYDRVKELDLQEAA